MYHMIDINALQGREGILPELLMGHKDQGNKE
jgi:hypothetical protein